MTATVKELRRRLERLMPAPLGPIVTLTFKDGTSRQVSFLEANSLIAHDRDIVDAVTDHKGCTDYLRVLIESWADVGDFTDLWKYDEAGGGADDRGDDGEVNSGAVLPGHADVSDVRQFKQGVPQRGAARRHYPPKKAVSGLRG